MYERFFGLNERPFALSPDPSYLYRSRGHSEALSYLRYGIEGYAGFIVVTGEVGSGKTTLLQTTLRSLHDKTSVSRLMNTMLDARELVEAVLLGFGLDPNPAWSKPRLLSELVRFLVEQRQAGRFALLVIDEAQNLSLTALEEVRMLSNFETERSKLLQIVLVGQPELRDALRRPELQQLRQRITVSYHLHALNPDETTAYINHRLRRAAIAEALEFPTDVGDLIQRYSAGVPRTINVIADAVLMFGYGEGVQAITVELAERAIQDLTANGILAPVRPVSVPPPAPRPPQQHTPGGETPLVQMQSVQTQPIQTQPIQTQPVQTQPVQSQPVHRQPVHAPLAQSVSRSATLPSNAERRRGASSERQRAVPPPTLREETPPLPIGAEPGGDTTPLPTSGSRRAGDELPYLRSYEPIGSNASGVWAKLRRSLFGSPLATVSK